MTCAPIWPPWGHVETINTNLHENLETREAWLFSFLNEYGQEKKTDTKLTKVESIVLNVLGLPNLSEV